MLLYSMRGYSMRGYSIRGVPTASYSIRGYSIRGYSIRGYSMRGILDARILDARVRHVGHRRHVRIDHSGRVERELPREHDPAGSSPWTGCPAEIPGCPDFRSRRRRIGVEESPTRSELLHRSRRTLTRMRGRGATRAHVDGARRAGSARNRDVERAAIGARDTAALGNRRDCPAGRTRGPIRSGGASVRLIGDDESGTDDPAAVRFWTKTT